MPIIFDENKRIFTLHTRHTTYQMQVDKYGYLLHLYYGASIAGSMDYLLTYADRGFSGNPYVLGGDRTYSLDALPQEYPTLGTGDYRCYGLDIKNSDGSHCCSLHYSHYEIVRGKYSLQGLPAVWAREDEAETLRITLKDAAGGIEVCLLYGVLPKADIITRSAIIKNTGEARMKIEKAAGACLDFLFGDFDVIKFYGRLRATSSIRR